MIAGRYSLDREIGRGGTGAVWLGRDEVLGRQVALKQIGMLPGADSTDAARAEREAQLTARLDHPHVVSVFNFVTDPESGARWLVMEYVDGSTLGQLVRREGRLSPDETAPLLRQVADALVAAHAAGVVHRDVKPSNILVDRNRTVKLTDFGIARTLTDPSLTQTGLVTGSPAYLAPEVAAGGRGDEAADVWSLGATVFFVLSGRPPYEFGDNLMGGLYRIVHEEPPRLADAGWMTALLENAMAKEPSGRWSMTQVRDFLATGPDRVTVPMALDRESGRSGTRYRQPVASPELAGARPAWRDNRLALAGTGLALVLVLGALLVSVLPEKEAVSAASPDATSASEGDPAAGDSTNDQHAEPAKPTARGMRSFIRDYVAAVSSDPDVAWQMLTPRFQRQSGGLDTYRDFWSGVGDARLLEIHTDPRELVVSYRVRFENFGTGQRPTVLDLVYDDGRYLIDGERTEGFQPAG